MDNYKICSLILPPDELAWALDNDELGNIADAALAGSFPSLYNTGMGVTTAKDWKDRNGWIMTEWLEAPMAWRSSGNLACLWGNSEWTCGLEQTWAIWQGLAENPGYCTEEK